ncbi:MAG TPA: amidotransferase 1, exosortase A system-associated [Chromatiales bacterium]|nr:amidotransferase 1, exosortase A system-associated [Chromatiales bacterium]
MCGLVGIFDRKGLGEIDSALLSRMNEMQFHRGPDEGGIHTEPGVGLAHRRLSIIDLSNGRQPLFNEDHSVVVVYNGEIYNHSELGRELVACGHSFRTHCDTEVIVHAWEEWGEDCVQKFRGMFAFVLWDRNKQVLFMARDRLGIKPLYYAELDTGEIIFSSELKALMIHPRLPRQLSPHSVEDYFAFGYVPDPKTIFHGVAKLSPGHTLTICKGEGLPEPKKYWDIQFDKELTLSEESAADELLDRLREAVRIRMVAEVPLGAFLSGGVDSSAVVSMMAPLSDEPINTCSISFGNPKFDESIYAERVASLYNTNHQVMAVDPDDYDLIDHLAMLYDEPFADSSAIPTYRVCEMAKQQVTVALSGDGGDEIFGGYLRYRWHMDSERLRSAIPQSIRRPIFSGLSRLLPRLAMIPKVTALKETFESISRDGVDSYFQLISSVKDPLRKQLFSDSFRHELQGYRAVDVFYQHAENVPNVDALTLIQYLDLKTYLPGDILTKVDRASMAASLEVRVPILDHKLVEWAFRLPRKLKLRKGSGKHIFKQSLHSRLPNDILYRRKMGFAVPLGAWFRGPLRNRVRDVLLNERMSDSGFFNHNVILRLLDEHQSGGRDHSVVLWTLLMFESFQRRLIEN